jgi:hypothetical protein
MTATFQAAATPWLTSEDYAARARVRSILAATVAIALSAASAFTLLAGLDVVLVVSLMAAVVVLAVFSRPILGVYLLFGSALLFEQGDIPGVDSITAEMRFFSNSNALIPLHLSVADLLLLLALVAFAWSLVRAGRTPRVGPLGSAVATYASIFVIGLAIGLTRPLWSADATLFELRGPIQMCLLYFLATNLIRSRSQFVVLITGLVGLVGVKAFQALLNYQQAQSQSWALDAVTSHEDVVFFDLAIALALVMAVLGIRTNLSKALFALLPLIICAELVTQRRVAFAALGVVILVIGLLCLTVNPRRVATLALVGVVALGAYVAVFWGDEGTLGQPIRAMRAALEPDAVSARDLSSDNWRLIENRNIAYTIGELPLTGVGVGQQYLFQEQPPSLTFIFAFWRNVTHNGLLWLWLKAGPLGGFALWFLVARVLLLGSSLFARIEDPRLRWMAVVPVALIAIQLAFSSVDMGLTQSRTMIVLGTVLGLDAVLFAPTEVPAAIRTMSAKT